MATVLGTNSIICVNRVDPHLPVDDSRMILADGFGISEDIFKKFSNDIVKTCVASANCVCKQRSSFLNDLIYDLMNDLFDERSVFGIVNIDFIRSLDEQNIVAAKSDQTDLVITDGFWTLVRIMDEQKVV